jgi:hypothetical protein
MKIEIVCQRNFDRSQEELFTPVFYFSAGERIALAR